MGNSRADPFLFRSRLKCYLRLIGVFHVHQTQLLLFNLSLSLTTSNFLGSTEHNLAFSCSLNFILSAALTTENHNRIFVNGGFFSALQFPNKPSEA